MTTRHETGLRELDQRANDGIEVTLLWQPPANRLFVDVVDDRRGDAFRIDVAASAALDAFRHPYAYLRYLDGDEVPLAA